MAVVVGASPVEKFWKEELLREFQPFMNRIEFIWFDQLTFDEMKQRVAELPPQSAILYAVLVDGCCGSSAYPDAWPPGHSRCSKCTCLRSLCLQCRSGCLGWPTRLGSGAGSQRRTVLPSACCTASRRAPSRRRHWARETPVYNWRELQRWGISEASLPSGSQVRFREPTVWEQYRSYLAAGVTIVLLQSALIAGLFWQRFRRRRAERETASLSGRLLMVHENERRRVARELHDDVTQRLAALAIDATRMEGPHRASADEATRSIRDGLIKLSEDVHALSYRLHPSVIEDLGLVEALKAECERVTRSGAVTVQFNASGDPAKTASRYGAVPVPRRTGGTAQRRPTCRGELRRSFRFADGRRTAACGQRQRHRFRPWQTRRAAEPRTRKHQGTREPAQGPGRYRQRSRAMARPCSHGSPYRWSSK